MEQLSLLWNTEFTVFTLFGYPVSLIELIGTIAGLLSVWFGTRNNILIWHFGFVNVIAFGVIFFQINLYADMLLQLFYFGATAYGLYQWKRADADKDNEIKNLSRNQKLAATVVCSQLALIFFLFTQFFPKLFSDYSIAASSYPAADSVLAAASVVATILMANRKIECWLMWIVIDAASIFLYLKKEVALIAVEFAIFTALAVYGYYSWRRIMSDYNTST